MSTLPNSIFTYFLCLCIYIRVWQLSDVEPFMRISKTPVLRRFNRHISFIIFLGLLRSWDSCLRLNWKVLYLFAVWLEWLSDALFCRDQDTVSNPLGPCLQSLKRRCSDCMPLMSLLLLQRLTTDLCRTRCRFRICKSWKWIRLTSWSEDDSYSFSDGIASYLNCRACRLIVHPTVKQGAVTIKKPVQGPSVCWIFSF